MKPKKKAFTYRGVTYFPDEREALRARDAARASHPGARVVHFSRGYAVQLRTSGPYLLLPAPAPRAWAIRDDKSGRWLSRWGGVSETYSPSVLDRKEFRTRAEAVRECGPGETVVALD